MNRTTDDATTTSTLDGQVALVTGGASGIGAAVVDGLAALGATVVSADVAHDESTGASWSDGPGIARRHLDVTDEASVTALLDGFTSSGLDIVVNAAGVNGHYAALCDLGVDEWDHTMAVNLRGSFLVLRAALPLLAERDRAAVVNVSSGAGRRGFANLADYVASKHGVIGLTRAVALEYGRTSVRVNAVCPGTVRTPMLESFAGSMEMVEKMGRMAPIGRVGEPAEIAAMICWLCTDAASFVTGAVMDCDGGVSAV